MQLNWSQIRSCVVELQYGNIHVGAPSSGMLRSRTLMCVIGYDHLYTLTIPHDRAINNTIASSLSHPKILWNVEWELVVSMWIGLWDNFLNDEIDSLLRFLKCTLKFSAFSSRLSASFCLRDVELQASAAMWSTFPNAENTHLAFLYRIPHALHNDCKVPLHNWTNVFPLTYKATVERHRITLAR